MHTPKHINRAPSNGWGPEAAAVRSQRIRRCEFSPGLRLFSFAVTQAQWRIIRQKLVKLAADTNRDLASLVIEGIEDMVLKYGQRPERQR